VSREVPREPTREVSRDPAQPFPFSPSAAPAVRVISTPAAKVQSVPPLPGPGSISAVAMPNETTFGRAVPTIVAPSAPPPAPAYSGPMFLSTIRPPGRSKFSNTAAAITALVIIVGAGYFGAMSGKKTTTPDTAPPAESTVAKVEPTPPIATTVAHRDPAPAPSPTVEPPPPVRTREPAVEAPPPVRDTPRESPTARRPASDEDAPRPKKTRAPRPTADDEGGGSTPPETRLPDPNDSPAVKPTVDQGALRAAFAEGEAKAKACLGATSPSGAARISVTFAPSGEAVASNVSGAPFQGTLEGQCMAAKFRTLHVPPFSGNEVIVRKSINFL
jgi:hypothetical protein